ncbi:HBAZ protein, partial [Atractosteus spatula]|nr:HBAZ protein [Atractosteus spatula]
MNPDLKLVGTSALSKFSLSERCFLLFLHCRLLTVFPQTKTYFTNVDITPGSAKLRTHGGKVMTALAQAAVDIDNMPAVLSSLSDLHAYILRVDPVNFKLLAHCILVVLANRLPAEFTPEAHVACDKFLVRVAEVLSQKYR